jgi:hypothetical protein
MHRELGMATFISPMSRRTFLAGGAALTGAAFCSLRADGLEEEPITKVHVVFKTHLDIGFTDLGERVVQTYLTEFIPRAMKLAATLREDPLGRRFKWTTGSWLIYKYLEEADDRDRKCMEDAILAGDVCWHALPFTTHSETLDASLFDLGITLSKTLDRRFGKETIGAKMTDVPGHTRGIVPRLCAAGIKFLHIGVNPASTPPKTPPCFCWQAPDGSSLSVMYDSHYGGTICIPGTSEAVSIILTGDNHGPPDQESVTGVYQELTKRFPGADVAASDLSQIAKAFSKVAKDLPVITSELGDSWIYGIGSDPLKIAQMRQMSRLRRAWIQSGKLQEGSDLDLAFGIPLVMVGEHTWGLDVKTHLKSWDIYTPQALKQAITSEAFLRMEASWQEKRDFIQQSVALLPATLKNQATEALEQLTPIEPKLEEWEKIVSPGRTHSCPTFSIALDPATGAIAKLKDQQTGRDWASRETPLALFSYQSFSKADYDRFMDQYLTQRPGWALSDFGKPGIEKINPRHRTILPHLTATWHKQNSRHDFILAELEMVDAAGSAIPGCPRRLTLQYQISREEPVVDVTLQWFDKAATRLPEALWLSFIPSIAEDGKWLMDKMGQEVDPCDVVEDGGHKMHAVGRGVYCLDEQGKMAIGTLDAPLAAPGERNLLNFDNAKPVVADGMHFCLCNNVWGTNFVMWYQDDMRFRFRIRCGS